MNETTAFIFALLAFAAGFAVRPFGAIVFGRLGDLIGRKYTFLVTILIMGGVDLHRRPAAQLRDDRRLGADHPDHACACCQGLALGGEYGGAATYVAEHAPDGRRGFFTSLIQTTATLGLFLSLLVILGLPHRSWARPSSRSGAGASRSSSPSRCSASRCGSACSCASRRCSSG